MGDSCVEALGHDNEITMLCYPYRTMFGNTRFMNKLSEFQSECVNYLQYYSIW